MRDDVDYDMFPYYIDQLISKYMTRAKVIQERPNCIRAYIYRAKMSETQFSLLSGVSVTTLRDIHHKGFRPLVSTMEKIFKGLNIEEGSEDWHKILQEYEYDCDEYLSHRDKGVDFYRVRQVI